MSSRQLVRAVLAVALVLAAAAPAAADNVVADDQIVQGLLCAGTECANGEAFTNNLSRIKAGDTPGINLVQTTSRGFVAQTWDVAGNEANFFVRDSTGGSLLPFRIRPGAATNSLDISANSEVSTTGIFTQDVVPTGLTVGAEGDGAAFLQALRTLSLFKYTINDDAARATHLAPSGRAFRSAFGLGLDDNRLAPGDMAAVALLAVKALDARVTAIALTPGPQGPPGMAADLTRANRRIRALERSNRRLARSLRALQRQVRALLRRG